MILLLAFRILVDSNFPSSPDQSDRSYSIARDLKGQRHSYRTEFVENILDITWDSHAAFFAQSLHAF